MAFKINPLGKPFDIVGSGGSATIDYDDIIIDNATNLVFSEAGNIVTRT